MHNLNLLTVDLEQRGLYCPRLQNVEFKCPKFSVLGQTGSLTLGQKERKTATDIAILFSLCLHHYFIYGLYFRKPLHKLYLHQLLLFEQLDT